ncbi:MAG: hypothetical protein RLY31_1893 [Bacteroidota bacterium]|jgi:hypothetical protein
MTSSDNMKTSNPIQMGMAVWPVVLTMMLAGGCRSDAPGPAVAAAPQAGDTLPEGFTAFYQRFHQDSLYQVAHIVFPLEGLPDHADSLTLAAAEFRWVEEKWRMQRSFDYEMSDYERRMKVLAENAVEEQIVHKSRQVGMVRRFVRLGGEWYLIYYAGMNRLSGRP